jgi:hypothetical protein
MVSKCISREALKSAFLRFLVLYGCEMWFLALKEHGLKLFEKRILRRMVVPKRDEII